MNSLDDFERLRPEPDVATADELDALWTRVVADAPAQPVDGATVHRVTARSTTTRSRRWVALVGAAASIALGAVAIASVSDRAVAPSAIGGSTSVESMSSTVTPSTVTPSTVTPSTMNSVPPAEPTNASSIGAGDPPLWGVTAQGWTLAEFEDRTEGPVDMVRLFAGSDGLATSWVAVVSGMSEPFLPADDRPDVGAGEPSPISTQRVATAEGSMAVIAGGVSDAQAIAVFGAVQGDGSLPDGFVEVDSASAVLRTIRYRFVNNASETIDIEVRGAGTPLYDIERSVATAEEFWDVTAGVDQSNVAYADEYTLLLRNGFWVTRVVTSAGPDDPATFTRLAELVEIVSADEWAAALPAPLPATSAQQIAIGDSVMLSAANELADAGFVVDAAESRPFVDGVDVVRSLAERTRLPATLVIALGANGPISGDALDEMMGLLTEVDRVVFVTVRLDLEYVPATNSRLLALPDEYDNVVVVDWVAIGDGCEGDCFYADGIHLESDGRRLYTDAIVDAVA